jgi:CheY-like chemotaxis protein
MKRSKEVRTPRQKLLLVDDDPNDIVLFAAAIDQASLDIALQTAVDGRQAIEQLEGRGKYADRSVCPIPDLILLDLTMSSRDGFDFLAWRRASRWFTIIPVFLYTGSQDKVLIQRALALGADRYIAKPHRFEDLKALVWDIYNSGLKPHLHPREIASLNAAFSPAMRNSPASQSELFPPGE